MMVSKMAETSAMVRIEDDSHPLGFFEGELLLPWQAMGIVTFAHGVGSSRFSPRNRMVAQILRSFGFGTLLIDLSYPTDSSSPAKALERMASRIIEACKWIRKDPVLRTYPIGLSGSGTGAAAALIASAFDPDLFKAIVLRGARLDLVGSALSLVRPPTLMIAGSRDVEIVNGYREHLPQVGASIKRYELVPGSSHSFEEPGALESVALKASGWFEKHLTMDQPLMALSPKGYAYMESASDA